MNAITRIILLTGTFSLLPVTAKAVEFQWQVQSGIKHDDTLTVAELDQVSQHADTALTLQGDAKIKWKITPKLILKGGISYALTDYQKYSSYDLAMNKATLDLSYRFDEATLGSNYYFVKAKLAKEDFLQLKQSSIYWSRLYQQSYLLRFSVDSKTKKFANLHERDSKDYALTNQHFFFFNQANNFVSIALNTEKSKANTQQFSYQQLGLSSVFSHRFTGWQLSQQVQLAWQYHKKNYQQQVTSDSSENMAPATGRKDNQRVTDLKWQVELNDHWSINSKVSYGQYRSTLESLTYNETVTAVSIQGSY
ncbi:MAG: hypothetical protein ACSHW0_03810 [Thalassotalea sp.]